MGRMELSGGTKFAGVALIAIVGLIHLIEAPEYFDIAVYVGLLFVANLLGAALSAVGILRSYNWGWILGLVVAGGALVTYVVSRTVGLPGASALTYADFLEPSGVIAMIIEALFVVLFAVVYYRSAAPISANRE